MNALFLLLLVVSGAAFAQGSANLSDFAVGSMAPSNGDPSLGVLNSLTGDVGGMGFIPGPADPTLAAMFAVFNTASVGLAAVLFMWHTLAATVNGAHDGEFLGKRYHSYWMPIRMAAGVFFIMPFMNGWSAAQTVMAWAAWSGTGIAAAVSSATGLPTSIANAYSNVPIPQIPAGKPLANNVYDGWHCIIEHRFLQRTALRDYSDDPVATVSEWAETISIDAGRITIEYGDKTGKTASTNSCGSVNFTFNPADSKADPAVQAMTSTFKVAVTNALLDMNSNAKNVALALDSFYAEDDWTNGGNAWDIYRRNAPRVFEDSVDKTLTAGLSGASAQAVSNAAQQITTHGWMGVGLAGVPAAITSFSAGSIGGNSGGAKPSSSASGDAAQVVNSGLKPTVESQKKSFTQIQDEMSLLKTNLDIVRAPGANYDKDKAALYAREYDRLATQAKETELSPIEKTENIVNTGTISDSNGKVIAEVSGRDILSAPFNSFMQKQARSLATVVAGITKGHSNPLAGMQEIGIELFGWSATLILILYPLLAGIALFSAGLGGLAGGTLTFVMMVLVPIMFLGLKLAAILPFAPMLAWLGAVTTYLVIFIESLFGAQLWAMAHMEGEGEGMGQKTAHGYLFVFNLMFRPAIMVISYYLATKLLGIMGGMGSEAIGNFAIAVSNNSSAGWLASMLISIGALWVWIAMMEGLIHTCYSLVTVIPNQVFAWLGAHFGSDVGGNIGRDAIGKAEGSVSSAGSVGGRTADMASGAVTKGRASKMSGKQQQEAGAQKNATTERRHQEMLASMTRNNDSGGGSPAAGNSVGSGKAG